MFTPYYYSRCCTSIAKYYFSNQKPQKKNPKDIMSFNHFQEKQPKTSEMFSRKAVLGADVDMQIIGPTPRIDTRHNFSWKSGDSVRSIMSLKKRHEGSIPHFPSPLA